MKITKPFLFFVILMSLFDMNTHAQTGIKNYEPAWKKVDELVRKNLPASALAEVKNIYQLARKEKQEVQIIKSLVYMTGLQGENRENNQARSIAEMEKEIAGSQAPARSILNSLLAEMYWDYYQSIRWELYNRTATTGFKKDDIATWSTEDFHKKIGDLYLTSLKPEKLLQQTKLDRYDAIIMKGNSRHLRPTLYDLLAFRALGYFENDERDIAKPAYAFEIGEASAFDPAADFVQRKFETKDTASLSWHALHIYQNLIRLHLQDAKPDALIDADILRISFVQSKSVHADKDQLFFNAIHHLARQYGEVPAATQAWYLVANYYNDQADGYKPYGDTTHRFSRLKAKEICEKVLKNKAAEKTEGYINCFNLLNQINSQTLQFTLEKVNVPGQPFRARVEYRNMDKLHLRLIKADESLKKQIENPYDDTYWSPLLAARPIREWVQELPAEKDLQQHAVEIKIDALPVGEYVLIAGSDSNFNDKKTLLGARIFYVSTISFISRDNDFFVLHRDNGQPLASAAVQVWEQTYDYKKSRYTKEKSKLYKTDANGFFKKEIQKDVAGERSGSKAYMLEITHDKDHLFINDLIHDYYYYRERLPGEPSSINSIFLFTDRSLYRPGQTLFFKGIVLNRISGEKKSQVNADYETTIYLRDANYQDIDTLVVKTNEFGSFSGKFQLPKTGLNGHFSIYTRSDNGNADFRVEEYKRPQFYVEYESLKGTYQVNDKIKLTGMAKAYAGNNIGGAMVRYRVVRQPRFIYPWLTWRWFPPSAPMEIAHGEATTDADGKFLLEFTAIPDLKIDRKLEPVFDYTVYADVTDASGETRSGEQTISVSYKSLLLKTTIPSTLPVDSLKALSIRPENMNGAFESTLVLVRITALQAEKRLIRERYWERPDQFIMKREEFVKFFPYDEYDNESDPTTWAKAGVLLEKTDSIKENVPFVLDDSKNRESWKPGHYMIEIVAKDNKGQEVKDVKFIELYDPKSSDLASLKYLWAEGGRPIEPGEKTTVTLGTSADNVFVIHQAEGKNEKTGTATGNGSYTFYKLNKGKRSFDFTATEADRGGYGTSWLFVKHNRVFQYSETINVSWSNKDLSIEYATYRDKTLPGSEEKWKLKISGYKKEKVAAEMLASMYDASLDQFYPHQWTKPAIWPIYFNLRNWKSDENFLKIESVEKPGTYPDRKIFEKQYDQLLTSPYNEMYNGLLFINGVKAKASANRRELQEMKFSITKDEEVAAPAASLDTASLTTGAYLPSNEKPDAEPTSVQIRSNFNETAFFFPALTTDSTGTIEFSFTLPDALTRWKFQSLAHTKDAALGYSTIDIVTQKQLMVQPNMPRFLREGDHLEFSARIANLTDKELTGQAELQLIDATTNQPVDGWFSNMAPTQFFTVAPGQNEAVKFPIVVPYQFNRALVWQIVATAGENSTFSDGEQNCLPVLTNRQLVTETMYLPMKGAGTKNFSFEKLLKAGESETLQHYSFTVEYTSNPAWYAIQALPYLMEYPYDCAEQTWNRYYANSLASMISSSSPRIKQVFDRWKIKDSSALQSQLQKNEELKAVLLEETPWVLQAKSEAEQKRNIALLFDMIRMSDELNNSYGKLKQMQSSNGGFVWFKGGPDDRYMTQYIVTGIGHLKKLNALANGQRARLDEILTTALPYLDKKIKEDYDHLLKSKTDLAKYVPDHNQVQYLYMRSFFPESPVTAASKKAYDFFRARAQQTWTRQNKYMQGMLVLALGRTGDAKTPAAILQSLKETAITQEELGMYWKDARRGWFWHEAPIERQALLIEAFQEIGKDRQAVDELRTWLLKNKQTNRWESTKATAEACYALLLQGTDWLSQQPVVKIKTGNIVFETGTERETEAGTGYFKKTLESKNIKPELGNISVTVAPDPAMGGQTKPSPSFGAVYWQYFEDLDKITAASTPLQLQKKLFVERNSDRGPVLTPVIDGDILKVGDKIKVRIELRVDREMEYVHMKDMRASAMEPVNVLSGYKWQGGLGYYETTKDASTHFFFNHLRRGTYVFEYPLFITHAGNFSNGITSIQCMYAPEFTSHSEGVRIIVE